MHTREDETFHILARRLEFRIGEQTLHAAAGDTVFGPRNVPHGWRCVSETPGRVLGLVTPGANFETFAMRMGERGIDHAAVMTDPDVAAALVALAAEFGVHILPPGGQETPVERPEYMMRR